MHVNLYVQAHSEVVLILLAEVGLQQESTIKALVGCHLLFSSANFLLKVFQVLMFLWSFARPLSVFRRFFYKYSIIKHNAATQVFE